MVIPSYWARERKASHIEGEAIYDHPTPLDSNGTLLRTIESLKILKDKNFQLVIIIATTTEDINLEAETKVKNIITPALANLGINILLFTPSKLKKIYNLLISHGKEDYIKLLKLHGYPNIRNLCIFIPHILESEVALLIDDDEVFEDPFFISKAREFIGKNIKGKAINGVAGYYTREDGDYHIKKPFKDWMRYWDQFDRMNEAFDKIIGTKPRLKETPFVFGGNMIIHRNLFTTVPFDPNITRGEDIDFLINAKMFGFNFFLDNQLSLKHLPPPKAHPVWLQIREDIKRFIYERAKIKNQEELIGVNYVKPEDFDPYPGSFLKDDLEEKIEKSSQLLSRDYLLAGDMESSKEALNNISIAKTYANLHPNPFKSLVMLQKKWKEFIEFTYKREIRFDIKNIIEKESEYEIKPAFHNQITS